MTAPADIETAVWVLIVTNFFEFFLGFVITGISYFAYRANRHKTSLRNATAGFGLITIGTAVEPAYQMGIVGTHVLASDQNLGLQIVEGGLVSLGFAVLFFSIYRYSSRSRRQRITLSDLDDEFLE